MGRHNNRGHSQQSRNNWNDVQRGGGNAFSDNENDQSEQSWDSQTEQGGQRTQPAGQFGGNTRQNDHQEQGYQNYQGNQRTQRGYGMNSGGQNMQRGDEWGFDNRRQGSGPYGYPQSGASQYPRGSQSGFSGDAGYQYSGQGGYSGQGNPDSGNYENQGGNQRGYRGQSEYASQSSSQGNYRGQSGYYGEGSNQRQGSGYAGEMPSGFGGSSQGNQGESQSRRGNPPRSYKRTDDRICEDVCERFMDQGIDCDNVDVTVKNGIVTLTGEIKSRGDKYTVEHIAAYVSGVQDVDNQIKVAKNSGSMGGSSDFSSKSDPSHSKSDTSHQTASGRGETSGYGSKK